MRRELQPKAAFKTIKRSIIWPLLSPNRVSSEKTIVSTDESELPPRSPVMEKPTDIPLVQKRVGALTQ